MREENRKPPPYCQYATGACNHTFKRMVPCHALFLYPSKPEQIAATIESTIDDLKRKSGAEQWLSWKDLNISGKIIFCEICKKMRFSDLLITDVTTLNFNLLFEIGFALGLNLPIIPIRDTSFIRDKIDFDELGLLDTVGYTDFQNSSQLRDNIISRKDLTSIPLPQSEIDFSRPLYVIKGHIQTDGEIKLLSNLKKSAVHFRTYDIVETPRISLYEIQKQVLSSLGVITHLLNPERKGAKVHNARCALIAGMAMSLGKAVLMLQEGEAKQPIDYRDVVLPYTAASEIDRRIEPIIKRLIRQLQTTRLRSIRPPAQFLQKLDLGDIAAENEIHALNSYFVESGQFYEAKKGHARIVAGRKGTGKTAIFYAVRSSFGWSKNWTILDLKPEGHQFTKLREIVLSKLVKGTQEHTITAFWNNILLAELAHKIVENDITWAKSDPGRFGKYQDVERVYKDRFGFAGEGDFSERLLNQVDRLTSDFKKEGEPDDPRRLTEIIYCGDIRELERVICEYLEEKEEVWMLVDNLDKGWPTRGSSEHDIMILRALLEATRKIQRSLERKGVNFHCLVFIRNDIYDHLVVETPDKGKDTAILIDCNDPHFFKEIFRLRIQASTQLEGDHDDMWRAVFAPFVDTRDSFSYLLERTLMRPRDFLSFVHRCIEVAINRGHDTVEEDDIKQAELKYSNDMLKSLIFELKDIHEDAQDLLCEFLGCSSLLEYEEVKRKLLTAGISEEKVDAYIELLVWFSFLGVQKENSDEPRYSYDTSYDVTRLLHPIVKMQGVLVVHPAFRCALECN